MKISVRCSSGEKYDVEFDPSITVADFKVVLSKIANIEAGKQRLIYRGKIMKDPHTMNSYDLQDGYAIHLVKGGPSAQPPTTSTPAPQPSVTPQQQPTASIPTPQATTAPQQPPQPSANPFASMFGQGQQGMGGFGMPNMQNMQAMMNNPEMMQQMMSNPMVQSMMNNPELMREMMMANPQIRQIAESNPEVGALLSDPEMLRRSMELARNPNLMREMMRNTDRAMSNIEGMPGGFDALRRLYTDVQQPLHEATSNMGENQSNPFASMFPQQQQPQQTSADNPLPNPWAAPQPQAQQPQQPSTAQPSANPWASMMGNMGNMGNMGMGAPFGQDFSQVNQMMQNPMMQQMMEQMLADPQFVDTLIQSNPQMSQMVQQMPFMRNMLANPQFIRSVMQMQGMMQGQQAPQAQAQQPFNPFAFMQQPSTTTPPTTTPPSTTAPPTTAPPTQGTTPAPNPFQTFNPAFWNQMMGQGQFGGFGAPQQQQPAQTPQQRFAVQLGQMKDMGFFDEAQNIAALTATNGNVSAAIEWLFANPSAPQQ